MQSPKPFQEKPISFIEDKLFQRKSGILVSPTGSGKTFMMCAALQRIQSKGLHKVKGHEPLILSPNALVTHWKRHCKNFGIVARVCSYEQLRSTLGSMLYLDYIKTIKFGVDVEIPQFKNHPTCIIADEVQKLKNPTSVTAQAVLAGVEDRIPIIACSATPFAKISESEVLYRAFTGVSKEDFGRQIWEFVAKGKSPDDYSPTSMQRLGEHLETRGHMYRVNNARFPFPAITAAKACSLDKFQMSLYAEAYEEYREKLAKLNRYEPQGIRQLWVAMLKFWQKSELLMASHFSSAINQSIIEGYQPVFAANFVQTLVEVLRELYMKYEISESNIAMIVGGQKTMERQRNIDSFNEGDKVCCLMTMKTGGLGVDLPHSKNNGKACPRKVIIPVCWSPMSYLQALGRCHRMNSISRTDQEVVYAENTIQSKIAERVMQGTRSLSKVMSRATQIIDIVNDEIICEGLKDIAEENAVDFDSDGDIGESYDSGMFEED